MESHYLSCVILHCILISHPLYIQPVDFYYFEPRTKVNKTLQCSNIYNTLHYIISTAIALLSLLDMLNVSLLTNKKKKKSEKKRFLLFFGYHRTCEDRFPKRINWKILEKYYKTQNNWNTKFVQVLFLHFCFTFF